MFVSRYTYRPRDTDNAKMYEVNPLGLVVRDAVTYLVCTLWSYGEVRQLALHRMEHASQLDTPADELEGFDLDDYIAAGSFAMPYGREAIRLEAELSKAVAAHLRESKISADQELEDLANGRVLLRATVQNTGELRWWLLGFGAQVRVRAPERLVRELSLNARKLGKLYPPGSRQE